MTSNFICQSQSSVHSESCGFFSACNSVLDLSFACDYFDKLCFADATEEPGSNVYWHYDIFSSYIMISDRTMMES